MECLLFSIVIPTRGRAGLLKRALASLEIQTYKHFEVLIVDDNDGDDIKHFDIGCFSFQPKVRKNTGEHGVSEARNLGIQHCNGDWIVFLDDDDEMAAGYLEILQQHIHSQPNAVVFWSDVKIITKSLAGEIREIIVQYRQDSEAIFVGASYGFAVNRKMLESSGLFDTSFKVAEDTELVLRLLTQGAVIKPIPYTGMIKHEVHNDRLSFAYSKYSNQKVYERLFKLYGQYFKDNRDSYSRMLLWCMTIHLRNKKHFSALHIALKLLSIGVYSKTFRLLYFFTFYPRHPKTLGIK